MRYSIEARERIYVKGYGFLSFAKNMGKCLSNKYGQKILDRAKKSITDAIKTASKREIQKKKAEATGDLIGNKIANKITEHSKSSQQNNSETVTNEHDKEIPNKSYVSQEKRQEIIDEPRLK